MPASASGAVRLFYSYSHKDEALRLELEKHLKVFERRGLLDGWSACKLVPGTVFDDEIKERLLTADVILLLVSPDFMMSEYIWSKELTVTKQRYEARQAVVIPIVLRPVEWEGTWFSRLQGLPKNTRPITKWPNQDEAFLDVARELGKVLQGLRK